MLSQQEMSLTAAEEVVKVRVQELFRAVCGGSEKQLKGLHWYIHRSQLNDKVSVL